MTDRFADAMTYAESLHRGQRRKGSGCAYVAHLLGVASLVMEAGGSEEECIAALLHDAVEDQGGAPRAAEIRDRFGSAVAAIVDACTEHRTAGLDWKGRKLSAIRKAREAGASGRLVIAADKLYNARALAALLREEGEDAWGRFNGGRDGTLWYYRSMADAIAAGGGSRLDAELEAAIRAVKALAGAASRA